MHLAVGADTPSGDQRIFQFSRQKDPVRNAVAFSGIFVTVALEQFRVGIAFPLVSGACAVEIDRVAVAPDLILEHRLTGEIIGIEYIVAENPA